MMLSEVAGSRPADVCIYEDRCSHVGAVRVLVASLRAHHPELQIQVFYPQPPESLRQWLQQQTGVALLTDRFEGAGSYNVKPYVLMAALARSASGRAVWLDTDIVVNGSIEHLLHGPNGELITSLDPWAVPLGSSYRSSAFRLGPSSRALAGPVNSAVVGVDRSHLPLLQDWLGLLQQRWYLEEQAKDVRNRNRMTLGDQDALSGLLASERHGAVKVRLLEHPWDILHHHGPAAFGVADRLRMGRTTNLPPLIHAMGTVKPWVRQLPWTASAAKRAYETLYLETSPYLQVAATYVASAGDDATWLTQRSLLARGMTAMVGGNTILAGLPQAALHQCLGGLKKQIRMRKTGTSPWTSPANSTPTTTTSTVRSPS